MKMTRISIKAEAQRMAREGERGAMSVREHLSCCCCCSFRQMECKGEREAARESDL